MAFTFKPILVGANLRDRLTGSVGGLIGIMGTAVCLLLLRPAFPPLALVAPIGASAVLVFAVPASPLAQPWPVIGGNVVSALVGVTIARLVPGVPLAAGLAVGGAILAMSLLRCLHPPGGAAALTAVIGGPVVHGAGFAFPFVPVGIDAILLTLAGLLFHRWSGHSYPHRPQLGGPSASAMEVSRPHPEDLDRALAELGDTFDISREDLELLFERAAQHARTRRQLPR